MANPDPPTQVILTPHVPSPAGDKNVRIYNSIRNCSENLSFEMYSAFLAAIFCPSEHKDIRLLFTGAGGAVWDGLLSQVSEIKTSTMDCLTGARSYDALRRATEVFVSLLGAPPETCRCSTGERRATGGRIEREALKEATTIERAEAASLDDDVDDINRRYDPQTITPEELRQSLTKLLTVDADLPSPEPGDPSLELFPIMRRLRRVLRGVAMKGTAGDDCSGVLGWRLECPPFVELIWSYWMEQGMLVQGINAIATRFQNQRRGPVDPLARLDITWLRPLNGLLWGYIQQELDRLTVPRRAYEYDHHYGLRLQGRAVPALQPADSRARFIEAFHNLLAESTRYYRQATNTTVKPDTFQVLNALKDVHQLLSEGAANQFGDLPGTARQEMLIQQWLIGRPEMQNFLAGRPGVVYPESWMGHMDSLRQMMGWNDASIRHYRDLAYYGERLLLSVRWVDWSSIADDAFATSWLTFWRAEIQNYVHSYRAVTGLDLNTDQVRVAQQQLFAAQPTDLILRRRAALPADARV